MAQCDLRSVYVHQLQATNGMIHAYQTKTLPKLLEVSANYTPSWCLLDLDLDYVTAG